MISIQDLSFSWNDAPPWVLHHLDLQINPGDYISIVGDNGSGKSTLIRLILGFLRPTAGTLAVDRSSIGYVPQRLEDENRGFPITVRELLATYRRVRKLPANAINDALQAVNMSAYQNRRIGDLSGGQRQKIAIARAFLGNPKLLVLDEPSTGIDPNSQKEIYALLQQLNQQEGITIVSVEHNLSAAITNSTSIYHLQNGSGHLCTPQQFTQELKMKG